MDLRMCIEVCIKLERLNYCMLCWNQKEVFFFTIPLSPDARSHIGLAIPRPKHGKMNALSSHMVWIKTTQKNSGTIEKVSSREPNQSDPILVLFLLFIIFLFVYQHHVRVGWEVFYSHTD